jgi:formate/nitrite transporter FocA (FNT family)
MRRVGPFGPDTGRARLLVVVVTNRRTMGLGGFNHVIAGSTKVLFLVATGAGSWGFYLGRFLVPTLVGNIIGGVSLVSFLGHAQVAAGKEA